MTLFILGILSASLIFITTYNVLTHLDKPKKNEYHVTVNAEPSRMIYDKENAWIRVPIYVNSKLHGHIAIDVQDIEDKEIVEYVLGRPHE